MSKSWWGLRLGMDEMGALLERWRIDEAAGAATDVPGADATGAGTLARAMVAGAEPAPCRDTGVGRPRR